MYSPTEEWPNKACLKDGILIIFVLVVIFRSITLSHRIIVVVYTRDNFKAQLVYRRFPILGGTLIKR